MQVRCVRSAVDRGDTHEHVFWTALRVLDEHVEIAVVIECAGVEEFVPPCPDGRGADSSPPDRSTDTPPAGIAQGTFMYECVGVLSR